MPDLVFFLVTIHGCCFVFLVSKKACFDLLVLEVSKGHCLAATKALLVTSTIDSQLTLSVIL